MARDALGQAQSGLDKPVDAVAISSFWHSLVCVDRSGRPITPVLTWRQLDVSAELPLDSAAVHARTGCPLHPSFWPLKIAGLKARGVRASRYLSFSDLLTEGRTSVSMASGTGLLGLDGRWDGELLEALGVREEQLPELADELVLGDGAAANLGSGALGRERAALTIGTSGALRTVHEPTAPRPGLFLYRVDGERVCEGGSISDGGNLLDWLERLVGPVETAGMADEDGAAARLPVTARRRAEPRLEGGRARSRLGPLVRDDTARPRSSGARGRGASPRRDRRAAAGGRGARGERRRVAPQPGLGADPRGRARAAA